MRDRFLSGLVHLRKKPVDEVNAKEKPGFAFLLGSDNHDGSKRRSIVKCRWTTIGARGPDTLALETTSRGLASQDWTW